MDERELSKNEDIITAISLTLAQAHPLLLTCVYQGTVINQQIKDLEIRDGRLLIRVLFPNMAACEGGQFFLYSPMLPSTIKTKVDFVNIRQQWVQLSDFTYMGRTWKKRINRRVQPKNPAYAEVTCEKKTFRASINDLSVSGMGLVACKRHTDWAKLKKDNTLQLSFQLSGDPKLIEVTGRVIYCHQKDNTTFVGLKLFPSQRQEELLQRYVERRARSIAADLTQKSYNETEYYSASTGYS